VSISAPFVKRPVATTLLTLGIALAGFFAYLKLPVAPLPRTDFPAISVLATLPGTSPQTMAATVATPLERHLGIIADVTEMNSENSAGQTRINLKFGLSVSDELWPRSVRLDDGFYPPPPIRVRQPSPKA
jgi:multidrug efflux pump